MKNNYFKDNVIVKHLRTEIAKLLLLERRLKQELFMYMKSIKRARTVDLHIGYISDINDRIKLNRKIIDYTVKRMWEKIFELRKESK